MVPQEIRNESELLDCLVQETNLIWSRYNAMVVADTIFVAVIATLWRETALALAMSCFGATLTLLWYLLTSAGWSLSHAVLNSIGASTSTGKLFHDTYRAWVSTHWSQKIPDPIWWFSHAVIAIFYLVYASAAVYFATKLLGCFSLAFIIVGFPSVIVFVVAVQFSKHKFSLR